jgi:hypothetical protein
MKNLLTALKNFWLLLFPPKDKRTFTSVSEYFAALRDAIANGQSGRITDLLGNTQWNWEEMEQSVREEQEKLFKEGEAQVLYTLSW